MLGQAAAVTDTGRKRRRNEDAFVVQPPLFAVADGMGGAQAGEIASRLAAEALRDAAVDGGGEERVISLIQAANRRVYERSHEDAAASGMGTTMTVALVGDGRVVIGHVGDSRAYRVREGELEQLTEDHSLVAELIRSGQLSPEEAERHPQRSVITRALGTDPDVDVDAFTVESQPGDIFLLCSDGLTTMVSDDEILSVVEENRRDLQTAAKQLVGHANRGGGEDNITVVFFEIVADGEQTLRFEPPTEQTVSFADEDTLTEADAIPAVNTAVISAEKIERAVAAAEAERARAEEVAAVGDEPARRGAAPLLTAVAVAVVIALIVLLLWLAL